jgi:hypothetical protein
VIGALAEVQRTHVPSAARAPGERGNTIYLELDDTEFAALLSDGLLRDSLSPEDLDELAAAWTPVDYAAALRKVLLRRPNAPEGKAWEMVVDALSTSRVVVVCPTPLGAWTFWAVPAAIGAVAGFSDALKACQEVLGWSTDVWVNETPKFMPVDVMSLGTAVWFPSLVPAWLPRTDPEVLDALEGAGRAVLDRLVHFDGLSGSEALFPRTVTRERELDPWFDAHVDGSASISEEARLAGVVLTVLARGLLPDFFTRTYNLRVAPASVSEAARGLPRIKVTIQTVDETLSFPLHDVAEGYRLPLQLALFEAASILDWLCKQLTSPSNTVYHGARSLLGELRQSAVHNDSSQELTIEGGLSRLAALCGARSTTGPQRFDYRAVGREAPTMYLIDEPERHLHPRP